MKYASVLPALLLTLALVACAKTPVANPDPNHTHADFAVWIDGKQLDFSGEEYMEKELTPEQEEALKQDTDAVKDLSAATLAKYMHLHDGNGHVMHRHKPGLTVADFFTSLSLGFTERCFSSGIPGEDGEECFENPFRLFVNGTERSFGELPYAFEDGDQLLVTNAVDQEEIEKELKLLTEDACMYSKTCPWRGEPPTENCIADPTVPCTNS